MKSKYITFGFIFLWLFVFNVFAQAAELGKSCENCKSIPEPILKAVKTSDFIVRAEILYISPPSFVEFHIPRGQSIKYRILNIYKGWLSPGMEIWVNQYLPSDADFKPGNTVFTMLQGKYIPNGMVTTLHGASGMSMLEATEANEKILDTIFEIFPN